MAGSGKLAALRKDIAAHAPAIVQALIEQAKAGDVGAAKLLLERAVPALRPESNPQALPLPDGTLTEQGRAVVAAVAAGQLGTHEAGALLSGIGTLARVVEVDELLRRVEALEGKHDAGTTSAD